MSDREHWFEDLASHMKDTYLRYSFTKGTMQEVDFILETTGAKVGSEFIDVGCGPGRHSLELARRGMHVTGVDVSQDFIDIAQRGSVAESLCNAKFERLDARDLIYRASLHAKFDFAICLCQGAFGLMVDDQQDVEILAGIQSATKAAGDFALEQLPDIVANGRKQAEKILEGIESRHRVGLQTREVVLPARDTTAQDWVTQQNRTSQREVFAPGQASLIDSPQATLGAAPEAPWANRLIYGDNLLAMAALLAGDENTPSLRGKVDLIYIDPPFDSKADYRTKVTLPGVEIEQKPTVIEQFAYSDTWSDGTASYLAMITPRLILMRELLADTGSIYVHLDWHVGHYVKIILDEIFGKRQLRNEIVWCYNGPGSPGMRQFNRKHDAIYWYSKGENWIFNDRDIRTPHHDKTRENFKVGLAGSGFVADTYDLATEGP